MSGTVDGTVDEAAAPSASLPLALCLLAGVVAAQALPRPAIAAAVALGGVAVALPRRARPPLLGLAVGLVLGWCDLAPLPAGIDLGRPVSVTARQIGDWRATGELWTTEARLETLRQGAVVARWDVGFRLAVPRQGKPPGARWRLRGALGRPPALGNRASSPAGQLRLGVKSRRLLDPLPVVSPAGRLAAAAGEVRRTLLASMAAAGRGRPGSRLARALALGDTEALPEAWMRGLRRTGTAHVVALSGLHLGVVAVWCALASRRLPRRWRFVFVSVGTLLYLALGGVRPSLVRAWLMVAAAGVTTLRRSPARPLHALVWAAAILAALDPGCVHDVGYRLTFAATGGVLLGPGLLPRRWPLVPRAVGKALGVSLGAQLATLPFALPVFHWLPAWAWLWNLLIVPAVAVAVPLCLAWAALAAASPALAAVLLPPLDLLAGWIAVASGVPAGTAGGLPWAGGGWAVAAGIGTLFVLRGRPRIWIPAAAAGVLVLALEPRRELEETAVRFLDVGQGDALLIREGGGGLLVDGGGWRGPGLAAKVLLPALGGSRLRRLEVVVLSHDDRDHCHGLLELAGYVAIEEIWMAPATALAGCGRELASSAGARLRPLWAGESATWRSWRFQALHPPAGSRARGNEGSLVLRAESHGRSLLLAGDIGSSTERRLLRRFPESGAVALLKVAHHGSASSSSSSFLRAAGPRLAVISAGRGNPYGHPAAEVLTRFAREGIAVLRTDRSGEIEVRWGPTGGWHVSTPGAGR